MHLEILGEPHQGRNSTTDRAAIPLVPEPQGRLGVVVIPEVFQVVLEDVNLGQFSVGRQ